MTLIALLLAGCAHTRAPMPPGPTVAQVNGEPITQGLVDAAVASLSQGGRDVPAEAVREQLILTEVLYQEALRRGVDDTPEGQGALALAERSALSVVLLDQVVEERVTDAAIEKWYQEHATEMRRPEVKARHILVPTEEEAKALLDRARAGEDFGTLAEENSVDKGSAVDGGSLGWFPHDRMVPEFADAAFAAEKGQIVGPVRTAFGWHVIEVQDRRDSVPLEEAREAIQGVLGEEIRAAYVEELRDKAEIK